MSLEVVIVEDEEATSRVLEVGMEELGLRAHVADDGEAGLELIRKRKPALAILDIMMPRMNGYEVCAAIQGDSSLRDTRIIMITGLAATETPSEEAAWREKLAVDDFIGKPFEVEEVQARVRRVLGL